MNDAQAPGLTFPCRFPVKAMGRDDGEFPGIVSGLIRRHLTDEAALDVRTRPSRNGRFVSVTVTIEAHNRAQLEAIYTGLKAHPRVLMVL